MIKLDAKELRTVEPSFQELKKIKRHPIYIVLDNVLDTYNVGSIFRLADAVAAEKIFLCGDTETPPNHKIKKASVDTWKWVEWEYARTAKDAVLKIRNPKSEIPTRLRYDEVVAGGLNKFKIQNSKFQIIAVEQSPRSVSYDKVKYEFPLALVVGHETRGVAKEVLAMADAIVEIPMWGVNKSLNVTASCGIVLYEVMRKEGGDGK